VLHETKTAPQPDADGCVLWTGPSRFDAALLVAIATCLDRPSGNAGTGDMIQTWILRTDTSPALAISDGRDGSYCGACPLRRTICYVNVSQAPQAVWRTYTRARYPAYNAQKHRYAFQAKPVRFGSYGDPAALPYSAWYPYFRLTERDQGKPARTGYTHAWRDCDQRYRHWLMASCDSTEEFLEARRRGWKPFRVKLPEEALLPGEFTCPKSAEADARLDCASCLACAGGPWHGQATPAITAHGGLHRPEAYRRLRAEAER
jgi:hypothetical protein